MKKSVSVGIRILWVVLVFMLIGFGAVEAAQQPLLLKIGTAGSGGTWYYVGSGFSAVVNRHVPEVRMNPEATAGGFENMRRLASRNLDFAITAPAEFLKFKTDKTSGPDRVSIIRGIQGSVMHFVVRADRVKGAKTVGEWLKKGGVLSIGEPGSSVQANTQVMLKVFGMTFDDLKGAHKLSQTESSEALKDGVIDAMFVGGDVPVASVSDTTQSVDAVILPFTEEDIKKFQQVAGYQFGYYIRANSYRGQTKEVYTVAYPPLLMVRSDLDSEIVYKIVKAIHENINEFTAIHPGGREWVLDTVYRGADWAKEFGYKFHPGMIKYLKEKKSWNPKYE